MTEFGYLRETSKDAEEAGVDKSTGLCRTGLEEYLSVIFPNVTDWVHDKKIPNEIQKLRGSKEEKGTRPDYRSESLNVIIEIDGLPHYSNVEQILTDKENTTYYESLGYKVVRIPWFIQLSSKVVKRFFGVDVEQMLFDDEKYPPFSITQNHYPASLPIRGLERMASEFHLAPEQYKKCVEALEAVGNDFLTGVDVLKREYEQNKSGKPCKAVRAGLK